MATPTPTRIRQGHLNRDKARTVRVRVAGDAAWLTVKGVTEGAARAEFEYPIPVADGEALLALCDGPLVDKLRHEVDHAGLRWEIDEFLVENAGLIVAEVDLAHPHQPVALPSWAAEEVTHDPRYFNTNLATHPFGRWPAR